MSSAQRLNSNNLFTQKREATLITEKSLRDQFDFSANEYKVKETFLMAMAGGPSSLLRFFARYTSWNSVFGSGVAGLSSRIGQAQGVFRDPEEKFPALADRSVFVASFFFDAARDEFDDRDDPQRDTHRCLAQAFIKGMVSYMTQEKMLDEWLDVVDSVNGNNGKTSEQIISESLLAEPRWVLQLKDSALSGYTRAFGTSEADQIMSSIGYHLGSEVLADQEFTTFDRLLRETVPGMVEYLEKTPITLGVSKYGGYSWIKIHSGVGGGAEQEHFDIALAGVKYALEYVTPDYRQRAEDLIMTGFRIFADEHQRFFKLVNSTSMNIDVWQ